MKVTKQSIKDIQNVVKSMAYMEMDLQKKNREKTVQKKIFKDEMAYNFSREIKGTRPKTQETLDTPKGINTIKIFRGGGVSGWLSQLGIRLRLRS